MLPIKHQWKRTIVCHVDGLQISNKDSAAVCEVITPLSDKYGKVRETTIRQGTIHDYTYLEMTLDFSEEGKLIVNME